MTIAITDKQVIPLFAVPLCKTRIEEPAPEIIDYLQNKISYTRMLHSVAMNSDDHNVLDREEVAPLRKALLDQVNEYLHNYLDADSKHEFYITTSWMNQYNKNDYSGLHYHSNSLISGVLYFDDCEDTADIIFHKDKYVQNIFTDTVNIDHKKEFDLNKKGYLYHQRELNVTPNKWDLVLFPSNLNHSVAVNASEDNKRWTLAFNTFVRGTIGDSTSRLVLK